MHVDLRLEAVAKVVVWHDVPSRRRINMKLPCGCEEPEFEVNDLLTQEHLKVCHPSTGVLEFINSGSTLEARYERARCVIDQLADLTDLVTRVADELWAKLENPGRE